MKIKENLIKSKKILCGLRPASADPQANWLAGKVGNRKEEGGELTVRVNGMTGFPG